MVDAFVVMICRKSMTFSITNLNPFYFIAHILLPTYLLSTMCTQCVCVCVRRLFTLANLLFSVLECASVFSHIFWNILNNIQNSEERLPL